MTDDDWADPFARSVALVTSTATTTPTGAEDGTLAIDDDFLVLVNGWWEPLTFVVPVVDGIERTWRLELDSHDLAAVASTGAPRVARREPDHARPAVDRGAGGGIRRRPIPTTTAGPSQAVRHRSNLMTLAGKVAIVTGGNSGIGKAVVLGLAEAGANIVIDYVANEQATEDLETPDRRPRATSAIGVEADVSKVEDLERLIADAVKAFGRLDIMVNNAGIETRTSVLDTTEAQYEKVMAINLKSAFFGTQLAAKQMIAQGDGGRIINITSVHEDWPMPGNTPYCVSKGGMRMLTRTAGVELGPHGITVVGVGPGRGGDADQHLDDERPGEDGDPRRRHPARTHGRARGDRPRRGLPRRRRGASYLTATTVFADGGIMHSSPGL